LERRRFCSAAPALECKHGVDSVLQDPPAGKLNKQIFRDDLTGWKQLTLKTNKDRPSKTLKDIDVIAGNPIMNRSPMILHVIEIKENVKSVSKSVLPLIYNTFNIKQDKIFTLIITGAKLKYICMILKLTQIIQNALYCN